MPMPIYRTNCGHPGKHRAKFPRHCRAIFLFRLTGDLATLAVWTYPRSQIAPSGEPGFFSMSLAVVCGGPSSAGDGRILREELRSIDDSGSRIGSGCWPSPSRCRCISYAVGCRITPHIGSACRPTTRLMPGLTRRVARRWLASGFPGGAQVDAPERRTAGNTSFLALSQPPSGAHERKSARGLGSLSLVHAGLERSRLPGGPMRRNGCSGRF